MRGPHSFITAGYTMESNVFVSRVTVVAALMLSIPEPAFTFQEDSLKVASQNPSPMVEYTRTHERVPQKSHDGVTFEVPSVITKPVQVFIPSKTKNAKTFTLLIHFHGANYVVQHAATSYRGNIIAATINLGSGSKVYNDAFEDSTKFGSLIDSIRTKAGIHLQHSAALRSVILSGFSAGYGAIRKIISTETNYRRIDAVILLDGLHTSYIPDRKILFEGGRIDSTGLFPYIKLAQDASNKHSNKKFIITHSEIFPGTFVSTTEATDYIISTVGLKRKPVLRWGPLGMQQISTVKENHFVIFGFAGNTAPDHIDHYHSLFWFLNKLKEL